MLIIGVYTIVETLRKNGFTCVPCHLTFGV